MNTTVMTRRFSVQVQRPATVISDGPMLGAATRARYGAAAGAQQRAHVNADALVRLLREAGLRGRGGAGFPAWRKLDSALRQHRPPMVVGNLSEGEPWSAKDHALVRHVPQLVLDGLETVRIAVGAREADLVVAPDLQAEVRDLSRRRRQRVRVHREGTTFSAGEASAVVQTARTDSRDTRPQFHLRPLTELRRPALVFNAETLAQIALLVSCDSTALPLVDTRLATITGAVAQPAVVEVADAAVLHEVLRTQTDARLALVGGVTGRWVRLSAPLDPTIPWGCGAVHALPRTACPLAATAAILDWLATQTAGQCGPCVFGLPALAESFHQEVLVTGRTERTQRLAQTIAGRGACHHPDGSVRLALAAMTDLSQERSLHAQGRCSAYGRA